MSLIILLFSIFIYNFFVINGFFIRVLVRCIILVQSKAHDSLVQTVQKLGAQEICHGHLTLHLRTILTDLFLPRSLFCSVNTVLFKKILVHLCHIFVSDTFISNHRISKYVFNPLQLTFLASCYLYATLMVHLNMFFYSQPRLTWPSLPANSILALLSTI